MHSIIDGLVKSRNIHNFVIPVKTGIQSFQVLSRLWIPAYAGMTDFLRLYHKILPLSDHPEVL